MEVIEQSASNGYVSADHFRQTFVPSVSGYVTEVRLRPANGGGVGTLSLLDGAGDGTVLGTESVTWVDGSYQAVAFTSPVPVTAGLTYTIAPTGTPLRRSSFASDPYPDGEIWFQRLDLGGVWQGWTDCIADGVCSDAPHDLAFRVQIEDTPPVANQMQSWSTLKTQYR
ncbi:MAG TPA: hypothetical protein P5571_08930 [Candidatus Krumholzibacteria bacterium]|nr:hypothetical protein [Candidatus Krumholzibacteria bacterium]HRX51472.1 hypothetical protein [Candidatus Krumholzibacteria bacterium]